MGSLKCRKTLLRHPTLSWLILSIIQRASTYERKVKQYSMPKKLKGADWVRIGRRHDQRGGRDSAVYLNGALKPWEDVWKEIRRNRLRFKGRGMFTGFIMLFGQCVQGLLLKHALFTLSQPCQIRTSFRRTLLYNHHPERHLFPAGQ